MTVEVIDKLPTGQTHSQRKERKPEFRYFRAVVGKQKLFLSGGVKKAQALSFCMKFSGKLSNDE